MIVVGLLAGLRSSERRQGSAHGARTCWCRQPRDHLKTLTRGGRSDGHGIDAPPTWGDDSRLSRRCYGCLDVGIGGGATDFVVRNGDDERHEVTVSISGDFQPASESATVDPGVRAVFEDFVPKLDYDHEFSVEVSLDGTPAFDEQFRMDHGLDTYEIRVVDDGTIHAERTGY